MNVCSKHHIGWNDSRHASSLQFHLHCGIDETSSPGIRCMVCHQFIRHPLEYETSSMVKHLLIVLATVQQWRFGSEYGSEPTRSQIGGLGRHYTRTVNSGTVRWTSHNASELGGLSAGCPAGPSVDSYNALVFSLIIIVCYQNRIFNIQ